MTAARAQDVALKVYQGLVPKDYAMMMFPDLAELENVVPCLHPSKQRTTCAGGTRRMECQTCGRRFSSAAAEGDDK